MKWERNVPTCKGKNKKIRALVHQTERGGGVKVNFTYRVAGSKSPQGYFRKVTGEKGKGKPDLSKPIIITVT